MQLRTAIFTTALLCACNRGTVSGQVVDRQGKPVKGVSVSVLGNTAKTNAKGKFVIDKIRDMPAGRIVADFDKDGYFDYEGGARVNNGKVYIKVALTPREVVATVDAESGSSVEHGELTISVPPKAWVRTSDGQQASGDVNLFVGSMLPGQDDFAEAMPGRDFVAQDGGAGVLSSSGAIVFEAEDSEGNPVEVQEPVEICLNIPSNLLDVAPDEMPLWQLEGGTWVETAMATRVGDQYCFEMYNSGSLNCDLFSRTAVVQGTVCSKGAPVGEGVAVHVFQNTTYTDSAGTYGALVPACYNFSARTGVRVKQVPGIPVGMTRIVDFGCGDGDGSGYADTGVPSLGPQNDDSPDPFANAAGGSGQNNSSGTRDNDPFSNTASTSAARTAEESGDDESSDESSSWSGWLVEATQSLGQHAIDALASVIVPPPSAIDSGNEPEDTGGGGGGSPGSTGSGGASGGGGTGGGQPSSAGVAGPNQVCTDGVDPFVAAAAASAATVCETDADCPSNLTCIGGECQPLTSSTSCAKRDECCPGQDDSCNPPDSACFCDEYCLEAGDCCPDACSFCGFCN